MTQYETTGETIEIPEREIYRYLGYRGIQPEEAVSKRIQQCVLQLHKECHPRSAWEVYDLQVSPAKPLQKVTDSSSAAPSAKALSASDSEADSVQSLSASGSEADSVQSLSASDSGVDSVQALVKDSVCSICFADVRFQSRDLSRNLQGCSRIALMAATIGTGVDYLIRRAEAVSMLDAAIYQAAGAAMVEAWCDEVNTRINAAMEEQSLFARPRFSPGYGDVPLALQSDFARLLNMPGSCGISLTDTLLMVPSKSVTAFIGFSPSPQSCVLAGCEICNRKDTCSCSRC